MNLIWALILSIFLISCSSSPEKTDRISYEISGRDHTPIYRVKAPKEWIIKRPETDASLQDTSKSLVEFFIQEGDVEVRITIHNFPSNHIDDRIPPIAQIMRWKQQFDEIDVSVSPQSFAGFVGLLFDGLGVMKGKEMSLLGWSMQMAARHYNNLSFEMRADYTIKALGPTFLVEKNRQAIVNFARSFELLKEIP